MSLTGRFNDIISVLGKSIMIALVTGASRGIGKAIALALAQTHSASLFLVYQKNEVAAASVKESCEALGVNVMLHRADISVSAAAAGAVVDFPVLRAVHVDRPVEDVDLETAGAVALGAAPSPPRGRRRARAGPPSPGAARADSPHAPPPPAARCPRLDAYASCHDGWVVVASLDSNS